MEGFDYIIVGAGFSGAVVARELAETGKRLLVIDKRDHVGGNAFDKLDENGVLIHVFGPHIFHTKSLRIFRWLSRFTNWRFYEHRVLAKIEEQLLPIPINKTTINKLYGLELDEAGIEDFLNAVKEKNVNVKTSEDAVLSSVGYDLCEKFFRGYTKKQWGLDLSELKASVAARIPTRTNDDDRYFTDEYQFIPLDGYTKLFDKILDHKNITVKLNCDYRVFKKEVDGGVKVIYTGPIDEYFDYCLGRLQYRSLEFKHESIKNCEYIQPVGTINYPNDFEYTRVTEFKHITGQSCSGTSIVYEFPRADGDPYYPVPTEQNELLYREYEKLADKLDGVYFIGRLGQYRYYNMDQAIAAAIQLAKRITNEETGDN